MSLARGNVLQSSDEDNMPPEGGPSGRDTGAGSSDSAPGSETENSGGPAQVSQTSGSMGLVFLILVIGLVSAIVYLATGMLGSENKRAELQKQQQNLPAGERSATLTQQQELASKTAAEPSKAKALSEKEILSQLQQSEKTKVTEPLLITAANRLALEYGKRGDFSRAEQILSRSIALCRDSQGPDRMQLAASMNNLALLYMQEKKYGKAEPLFQSSLILQQDILGKSDPHFAGSINNLATLYYEQRRFKDALPLYERALMIYQLNPARFPEELAKNLNNVASCYSNLGQNEKAEKFLAQALDLEEKMAVPNERNLAAALNNLGYIYAVQSKYEKAEPLLKRGLSLAENSWGNSSLELVSFLDNNAYLLRKTDRESQASLLRERAKKILVANNR